MNDIKLVVKMVLLGSLKNSLWPSSGFSVVEKPNEIIVSNTTLVGAATIIVNDDHNLVYFECATLIARRTFGVSDNLWRTFDPADPSFLESLVVETAAVAHSIRTSFFPGPKKNWLPDDYPLPERSLL